MINKILILNDIHHGETRESTSHPGEIRQANSQALTTLSGYIDSFNTKDYDCVINLGDAIRDVNSKEKDTLMLDEVMKIFARIKGHKFFIPGNHELKTLNDEGISMITSKYDVSSSNPQMFMLGKFQILLVDSEINDKSLGSIPKNTLAWLENKLDKNMPIIVFSHYSLVELDGCANFYFDQDYRYMSYTNGRRLLSILRDIPKVISINAHTHMGSFKQAGGVSAVSALAFSENIVAMNYPDANPGVYSEIWMDDERVFFKSFSGKYCFLSIEL